MKLNSPILRVIILAVILLFFLIVFLSCGKPKSPTGEPTTTYGDYTLKVIDGCQYIEYDYGYGQTRVYSLTHKGNCKTCRAFNQKQNQQ